MLARQSSKISARMASNIEHSLAEAFQTTLHLFDFGVQLMRQNLKRAYPTATDEEIDARLDAWLHERPGAEAGDCGLADDRQ
jgi:hypothetical protein